MKTLASSIPRCLKHHAYRLILTGILLLSCAIPAGATPKGIIIYSEHAISDPTVMEFESISWKDGYIGEMQYPNGRKDTFVNLWCKKIVYFDSSYFKSINDIAGLRPMRARRRSGWADR